jgi:hypothetical protein
VSKVKSIHAENLFAFIPLDKLCGIQRWDDNSALKGCLSRALDDVHVVVDGQ